MPKNILAIFILFNICFNVLLSSKLRTRTLQRVDADCADLGLVGSTITASCQDADGEFHTSSLNLDECFGASDGIIIPGGRNYSAGCNFCYVFFFYLVCSCQRADTAAVDNNVSINLADHLTNNNRTLSCN